MSMEGTLPAGGQGLLARLLIDASLAEDLRADPEGFARLHGADPELVRRLAAAPLPGLQLTASITASKRKALVTASFPGSSALLRDTAEEDALLRSALERRTLSRPEDSLAVGRALVAAAAELPNTARVRLLRQMLAFETLWYEARVGAGEPDPPAGPPALRPGVVLGTFDRPIAEIQRLVLAVRPVGELPEGTTHYLLHAATGSGPVRTYRLPSRLAEVLAACDGVRTTRAVAYRVGLDADTAERSLRGMVAKGFLGGIDADGSEYERPDAR
ncbi:hypothetical protein JOD64_005498 [Micromonospora luteifusca]|uniref:Uncharacterized protein n=1 Tax=Micromonospora luteifusca TaxID=709860 RepID=A0ABS2M1E1_9ACTN|nr:hypothetical protein [Micromonospora luteifusca]MBM7494276.1 hypothetical protein [Micromonospora luteifusca]